MCHSLIKSVHKTEPSIPVLARKMSVVNKKLFRQKSININRDYLLYNSHILTDNSTRTKDNAVISS
jgi:hypothetical protein